MEAPPVEEEVDTAKMDVEEEEEAPTMNVEEEWKKRAKAMKSQTEPLESTCRARSPWKRGSDKGGSGRSGSDNTSARPAATGCRGGAGRHDHIAATRRRELERVRSTGAGGASSSRAAGGSPSLLEAQLARVVLRAKEAQRHLEERERDLQLTTEHAMDLQGQRDQLQGESERDQLRIRAEAAEVQVEEATKDLAALKVQRPPGDQEEVTRLCAELLAQQAVVRSLQQIVTDIGRSRSRSRSGASVSRATGASVGQYLAGSSSRRRNEEEERRLQGKGSAQSGKGGGEMPPPLDCQEGSGESGGGH
ncbi:hypothetical protein Taro_051359 [Colocasia esculenta]|uniref:Uncharacterized protein n=1 Tax=Colocasia esculenta TaxID=4460 RepID=A0A843XGM7_COLES|nr:hypothetical protein [Colocasia esculenta]